MRNFEKLCLLWGNCLWKKKTEKVHGTRNDYKLVEQDNYLLVDGLHEAIVSEEVVSCYPVLSNVQIIFCEEIRIAGVRCEHRSI